MVVPRPGAGRPSPLSVTDVAELQRAAGNAAVTSIVRPSAPARPALQRVSVAKGEGAQTWVRPGDTGPDVTKAQQRLNGIGAPGTPLAETGVYDAAMRSTVSRFQTAHGLDPDGIVGPLTYEAMDREDSAGTDEAVAVGTDHTATADAPTKAEIDVIKAELNPTSTGSGGAAKEWDGRSDAGKRTALDSEISAAMQKFLNDETPKLKKKEAAKAAGRSSPPRTWKAPGAPPRRTWTRSSVGMRRRGRPHGSAGDGPGRLRLHCRRQPPGRQRPDPGRRRRSRLDLRDRRVLLEGPVRPRVQRGPLH